MPTRKGGGGGGGSGFGGAVPSDPCTHERDPLDVAGRFNDLINCYLSRLIPYLETILPIIILVPILMGILLLAAYMFLKG